MANGPFMGPLSAYYAAEQLDKLDPLRKGLMSSALKSMNSPQRALLGMKKGWKMGIEGGAILNPLMLGVSVATSQRGEALPALVTGAVGIITYGIFAAVIEASLMLIPVIGPVAAGYLAMGLAMAPEMKLESKMMSGLNYMTKIGAHTKGMQMGGGYTDTDNSSYQRKAAISEMSGATIPSRRYLGQEARLFHR